MLNTHNVSAFRQFCQEKWFEHRDEILAWTGQAVQYDSDYYFRQHRWLLKSMFKQSGSNKNGTV